MLSNSISVPLSIVVIKTNDAVAANENYIKSETLTESLVFITTIDNGTEIEFDNIKTRILISK